MGESRQLLKRLEVETWNKVLWLRSRIDLVMITATTSKKKKKRKSTLGIANEFKISLLIVSHTIYVSEYSTSPFMEIKAIKLETGAQNSTQFSKHFYHLQNSTSRLSSFIFGFVS